MQAGAYPGFCSMKLLGVFLFLPRRHTSPSQGYPQHTFTGAHLYTWVERGTVEVLVTNLDQAKNTTQCLLPGLKPGPLDPEMSALTQRNTV